MSLLLALTGNVTPPIVVVDVVSGVRGKKHKPQSIKLREVEFKESTADYINRILRERQQSTGIANPLQAINIPLIQKPKSNEEAMKILIAIAELI